MAKAKFIHLHVHSTYSFLEGSAVTKDLIDAAKKDRQPAIAITDTNNLFGSLEFTINCLKEGVQPIIGCFMRVDFETSNDKITSNLSDDFGHLVFLAATEEGLNNLIKLNSLSYLGSNGRGPDINGPLVKLSWMKEYSEGVIVLTGGINGPINKLLKDNNTEQAKKSLEALKDIYANNLYIELQRYPGYNEDIEAFLLEQALNLDIEIVACNEVFFVSENDYEAHDALLAISAGQLVANKNRRKVSPSSYLRSQQEMVELFSDLPSAVANTIKIAQLCTCFIKKRSPILPSYNNCSTDPNIPTLDIEAEVLKQKAHEGLLYRLENYGAAEGFTKEDYIERLEYEIGIIVRMKFPGYFLIVSDFISWAKDNDIPVGPGRGSGAGSLVAYALRITDIDPLRFSLLFERFLNPERVSMPDFDIDFCQDRRLEVIKYVQKKYGSDRVAHIITFGKLQARAVLRDVGRVLEIPYAKVDNLCKLVPQNPAMNITLSQSIKEEPKFKEERLADANIDRLLNISQQLEGLYRHASTHAAGIVIGDRPLQELVPLYFDAKAVMPVTQYNMKYVEQVGLVKFDFLGLKTLSVLKKCSDTVRRKNKDFLLSNIDLSDPKTYKLLSEGNTLGVFQVESAGMQQALMGMKPDCIEDIIALVALYRPGPMENIPIYNQRKHGLEEIEYIDPALEKVLKETQGVIVYQEQVMQIAQILAGYSLGEADLLRRAMGKKIHSEMEVQRARFVSGAVERGLNEKKANDIFNLLAKFADYGFNKSHAAAYALISYQTAYMKANYPIEFLAAVMTYDLLNTEKLNIFRLEAKRLKIEMIPPSIQTSSKDFEAGEGKIYYSLAAVKGVGESVADHIAKVRGNKPFADLEDFCNRINPKELTKGAMEGLIKVGAFDCFGISRDKLFTNVTNIMRYAFNKGDNQRGLYDHLETQKISLTECDKKWSKDLQLHNEFTALGFYLSGHPLDRYNYSKSYSLELKKAQLTPKKPNESYKAKTFFTAGTLIGKLLKKTRKGERMVILTFSQPCDQQFDALLFSDKWNAYNDKLILGNSMYIEFELFEYEDKSNRINIKSIKFLDDDEKSGAVEKPNKSSITKKDIEIKGLSIAVYTAYAIDSICNILNVAKNTNAYCNVKLIYHIQENSIELDLGYGFNVTQEVYDSLSKLEGIKLSKVV